MSAQLGGSHQENFTVAVVVSAAVLNLVFGCVKLLNLFQIKYYLSYTPKIVDLTIFSHEVDFWVWAISFFVIVILTAVLFLSQQIVPDRSLLLLCLACIASFSVFLISDLAATLLAVPLGFLLLFFFISHCFHGRMDKFHVALFILLGAVSALVFVELASLSAWIWNIFNYEAPFGASLRWTFASLDVQLFNIAYPVTSWLFIALLYSWILIPLSKALFLRLFRQTAAVECAPMERTCLRRRLLVLSLALIAAAAVFVAYYACFRLPSSALVGTDSTFYYERAQDMSINGSFSALQRDRPISDFVLYFVQKTFSLSAQGAVLVMPVICAIGMALAVFFFVRVGTKNDLVALVSALFSTVSFQMTVSIFAYSLANWIALIEAFIFLALLLKSFDAKSWRLSVASAFLGIMILLTHPYTWDVVMAILVVYFAWVLFGLFRRKIDEKADLKRIFAVLVSNVGFYVVYAFLPFGKGVADAGSSFLSYASPNLGLLAFLNLKNGLDYTIQSWVGGSFAAPLLIVFSILGMFSMMDFSNKFNRLTVLWVAVPSIMLFFVSPESYFFYRILYLLPCQVLAALGLFWAFRKIGRLQIPQGNKKVLLFKIAVMVLVVLFLLNYALRSVDGAPLYLIKP